MKKKATKKMTAVRSLGNEQPAGQFNWQQKGWPMATVDKAALKDELDAFKDALGKAKKLLKKPLLRSSAQ